MSAQVIPFPSPLTPVVHEAIEWWMDERAPAYQDCLEIRYTRERGRGVFAMIAAKPGQVVEVAPYVPVPIAEIQDQDILATYVYEVDEKTWALGCGYANLYNHSSTPNVTWDVDEKSRRLIFKAVKDIRPGEELMIDYRGEDDESLWFEER